MGGRAVGIELEYKLPFLLHSHLFSVLPSGREGDRSRELREKIVFSHSNDHGKRNM